MVDYLGGFDAEKLSYAWSPADPRADHLQAKVRKAVQQGELRGRRPAGHVPARLGACARRLRTDGAGAAAGARR